MRLISGIVHIDGSLASPRALKAMCNAMQSHVRQARIDIWTGGCAGLAVMTFDVLDTCQRIVRTPTGTVVATDVRLDNDNDLRLQLSDHGASDVDLAAKALDTWGSGAADRLRGDFALAAWSPALNRLQLSRDIFGVRPLFYAFDSGRHLAFASFPRALFASGLIARNLDELALANHMLSIYKTGETIFRGVQAVHPGQILELMGGELKARTYWRPTLQPLRKGTPIEAAEELRSLIVAAVASRIRGCAPVAAHLSGGLDSSAIAVLAARDLRAQQRSLLGYSFLMEPQAGITCADETPYVQSVLRQEPSIIAKAIRPQRHESFLQQRFQTDHFLPLDESDPENAVCADASALGANVVLSGWGGDEGVTFNGRWSLTSALLTLRWHYLGSEIHAMRTLRGWSVQQIVRDHVIQPLIPQTVRSIVRRVHTGSRHESADLADLLNPELRKACKSPAPLELSWRTRQSQWELISSPHLEFRSANWAASSAQYGMACVFPFLDRRLVNFALSLPPTWHIRGGWKRRVFRDAMEGILPPLIQWRHTKLDPFPELAPGREARRMALLDCMEELASSSGVQRLLDAKRLQMMIQTLRYGIHQRLDRHEDAEKFTHLSHVLGYARYVI